MTDLKDSVIRVSQLVLLIAAVMLSVTCMAALVSRNEDHKEITTLLSRYNFKDTKETDDPKNPNKKKPPKNPQVESICKRHVFSPDPPKKKFSPDKLIGILGDEVFFEKDNKAYKIGQKYKGAKITKIGPDWVELVFEDKAHVLHVFGKGGSSSQQPPRPPSRSKAVNHTAITATATKIPEPTTRDGPKLPPGFQLTPEMIEQFKSMSPEMQKKALEHAPAEIHDQLEKAI